MIGWNLCYDFILKHLIEVAINKAEAATGGVLQKNFTKFNGNTCARVSFLIKLQASACNLIKKEAPAQEFSWAFWETFTKHLFCRTLYNIFTLVLFSTLDFVNSQNNSKLIKTIKKILCWQRSTVTIKL